MQKRAAGFSLVFNSMAQRNTCLDVGGNIGNHTAFFSRYFKHVYALEPNPGVYEMLLANITHNRLAASAYNIGLSDETAELDFYVSDQDNIGSSSFEKSFNCDKINGILKAFVERGDDFIANHGISHIDFIKIDVEGHEAKVVSGLRDTIKKYQPVISLEWNNDITRRSLTNNQFLQPFWRNTIRWPWIAGGIAATGRDLTS